MPYKELLSPWHLHKQLKIFPKFFYLSASLSVFLYLHLEEWCFLQFLTKLLSLFIKPPPGECIYFHDYNYYYLSILSWIQTSTWKPVPVSNCLLEGFIVSTNVSKSEMFIFFTIQIVPLMKSSCLITFPLSLGSPCAESACQSRRQRRYGFDPWVEKIPWSRKQQPTWNLLRVPECALLSPWEGKDSCMRVLQLFYWNWLFFLAPDMAIHTD